MPLIIWTVSGYHFVNPFFKIVKADISHRIFLKNGKTIKATLKQVTFKPTTVIGSRVKTTFVNWACRNCLVWLIWNQTNQSLIGHNCLQVLPPAQLTNYDRCMTAHENIQTAQQRFLSPFIFFCNGLLLQSWKKRMRFDGQQQFCLMRLLFAWLFE